ncbi:MAG: hypothetical protein HC880_08660 [Bacteroidia bacterium]|nr:hypothetical protein [Bacteroidia bacterium]
MKYPLSILFLFLIGCQSQSSLEPQHLVGQWQADSLYSFDNGFEFMHPYLGTGQVYTYAENGKVSEVKDGLKQEFLYEIQGEDSLILRAPDGNIRGRYKILEISPIRMALKKNKKPWFTSKNQEMYNILYLSKKINPQ